MVVFKLALVVDNNKEVSIEINVIIAFISVIVSIFSFIISFTAYSKADLSDASSILNTSSIISLVVISFNYLVLIITYYNIHKNAFVIKLIAFLSFSWAIFLIIIFIFYNMETVILIPFNGKSEDLRFLCIGNADWINKIFVNHLSLNVWAFSIPCLNFIQILIGVVRCFYNKK